MKKLISTALCAVMLLSSAAVAVTADEAEANAVGVSFTAESGYHANAATGLLGVNAGDTADTLIAALEASKGITVTRDGEAAEGDLANGDVLATADGSVSFSIVVMGDANGDAAVKLTDASAMMKKIARWEGEINEIAADVNGDGAVTLTDASTILKKVAKWDAEMVMSPVLPGKIIEAGRKDVTTHSGGGNNRAPLCLSDDIHYDLGVTFTVGAGYYATVATLFCPSWAENTGILPVSVYKWMGDYETTIATMPVVTKVFVDYRDNSYLTFDLTDSSGKGIGEGEYLLRIYDCSDENGNGVGVWYYSEKAPAEDSGMTTYLNKKPFNIGPDISIRFITAE